MVLLSRFPTDAACGFASDCLSCLNVEVSFFPSPPEPPADPPAFAPIMRAADSAADIVFIIGAVARLGAAGFAAKDFAGVDFGGTAAFPFTGAFASTLPALPFT